MKTENKSMTHTSVDGDGVFVAVNPRPVPGMNGGCGTMTHVVGTNGGAIPCGAFLTMDGKRKPYYCALCSEQKIGLTKN